MPLLIKKKMENNEVDPDKYKTCSKYKTTPGGNEGCKDCSSDQKIACFNRHSEEYSKKGGLLPNDK